MKTKLMTTALALMLGACATTGGNGENWTCTAKGLQQGSYSGGSTAYIHLKEFSKGARYGVTLSDDGRTATGKTGNGTPFSCTKNEGV